MNAAKEFCFQFDQSHIFLHLSFYPNYKLRDKKKKKKKTALTLEIVQNFKKKKKRDPVQKPYSWVVVPETIFAGTTIGETVKRPHTAGRESELLAH